MRTRPNRLNPPAKVQEYVWSAMKAVAAEMGNVNALELFAHAGNPRFLTKRPELVRARQVLFAVLRRTIWYAGGNGNREPYDWRLWFDHADPSPTHRQISFPMLALLAGCNHVTVIHAFRGLSSEQNERVLAVERRLASLAGAGVTGLAVPSDDVQQQLSNPKPDDLAEKDSECSDLRCRAEDGSVSWR